MSRKYVQCEDARANQLIDSQLEKIVATLLKNLPDVRSVVITGGFGKGEGSIEFAPDNEIRCTRDFDIVCIVDRKPSMKNAEAIHDQIYKSLGLKNPEFSLFRSESFTVDLKFMQEKDLIYRDIYFYDLKAASQILWGEDLRNRIPWNKRDVPWSSGLRVLFEKVIGLLGHFSIEYLKKSPEGQERKAIVSESRKTIIEIGTALCILAGRYEPTFAERANVLQKIYSESFPALGKSLPELAQKIAEYTESRLRCNAPCGNDEDPIESWFSAQKTLREVLRFYVEATCQKTLTNWNCFPDVINTLAMAYYKPFLGSLLSKRLRLRSRFLLNVANLVYQGLANLEYAYVFALDQGKVHVRPLLSWRVSPSLKYFSAAAMLLFSLREDGTVDHCLIRDAAKQLRRCVPVEAYSSQAIDWEELRRCCLEAHGLYRGYHLVK